MCQTHDPPRNHHRMMIALGAIRFISCDMLGPLIRTQREIDRTEGALRLCKLNPRVPDSFKIRRLKQR